MAAAPVPVVVELSVRMEPKPDSIDRVDEKTGRKYTRHKASVGGAARLVAVAGVDLPGSGVSLDWLFAQVWAGSTEDEGYLWLLNLPKGATVRLSGTLRPGALKDKDSSASAPRYGGVWQMDVSSGEKLERAAANGREPGAFK